LVNPSLSRQEIRNIVGPKESKEICLLLGEALPHSNTPAIETTIIQGINLNKQFFE
jgi:hypothetical protein